METTKLQIGMTLRTIEKPFQEFKVSAIRANYADISNDKVTYNVYATVSKKTGYYYPTQTHILKHLNKFELVD